MKVPSAVEMSYTASPYHNSFSRYCILAVLSIFGKNLVNSGTYIFWLQAENEFLMSYHDILRVSFYRENLQITDY